MLKRLKDPNDHFGWDNVCPFICQIAADILCMLFTICTLTSACMSYFGEVDQGELFNQCTLVISLNGAIFMLLYIVLFCLVPIVFKSVVVSLYSRLKEADTQ